MAGNGAWNGREWSLELGGKTLLTRLGLGSWLWLGSADASLGVEGTAERLHPGWRL